MPVLEVKARRMGGATYQVPMEVRPERRQTLGLRWMTKYARLRNEKTMKEKLAGEIYAFLCGDSDGERRNCGMSHVNNVSKSERFFGRLKMLMLMNGC